MLLECFVEDYNGAPLDLRDFADAAVELEDCNELRNAAQEYLDAIERFEETLTLRGVIVG